MHFSDLGADGQRNIQEILGYLNFSSGAADARFLGNLNTVFGLIEDRCAGAEPAWKALGRILREGLAQLRGSGAFRQVEQVEAQLALMFDRALRAYRGHHRDLLFHQSDEQLFRPFFIGRMCEALLQQGGPWDQAERIIPAALRQLNDYLGHRPMPVLRTEQKIQPYDHEWVRPIPLFVRGAGVAVGRYQRLVEQALAILETTDPAILFQAFFAPEMLDELAMDPRAYDFDHPVNKRPNYLFGQWDLGKLDLSGRCRRFVVQQVALEGMLRRVEDRGRMPYEEAMFEASAVLAGTVLMGSGVSGDRPEAHSSTTTLATLVQQIAAYRDAFYEQLLSLVQGPQGERLRAEAVALKQPFGGARQHFNQYLARCRAAQLQHVHLAQAYARMGAAPAAVREAAAVATPSARMRCDMLCRATAAHLAIERGRLAEAAAMLPEIEELLQRAIQCGAMVDPWNILGFGAQYSLFPAPENSVHDHRVDELIAGVGDIFDLYVRIQKEAAAVGETTVPQALAPGMERLAAWWDKYASTTVSDVEGISGAETKESADLVAAALRAWHEAGTAAGDLAFWRGQAQQFRSPKAYALVVEALLEHHDLVAAMALLVHWLSQAGEIALVEETYSFHELALLWMEDLWQPEAGPRRRPPPPPLPPERRWTLAKKFFDYLEANAEGYWQVPQFELAEEPGATDAPEEASADEEDLYAAAYEDVSYRDTAEDGFDGTLFETGENPTDVELVHEAERLVDRLAFLATLAQLWKAAAVASFGQLSPGADRDEVLGGWLQQAMSNRGSLLELLSTVQRHPIPAPRGTFESLLEYDRRRTIKETLLEQIIATCVETTDAARMIRATMQHAPPMAGMSPWEEPAERMLRAVLRSQRSAVQNGWRSLRDALRQQPLLYVALGKGGNPLRVVVSRSLQRVLSRLLAYLPRLGMLRETCRLLEVIHQMETDHPVGPGAITEFDQLFEIGCKAIARCLVVSAEQWHAAEPRSALRQADVDLIGYLEQATEALLQCWLMHSQGVRLSVLEQVHDNHRWRGLKGFIEHYGHDLFTQRFMNLGNLRAILHEGVDGYLQALLEDPQPEEDFHLLSDLDGPLPREEAVRWMTLAIEAVVENYPEYVDYNSTTTQSDRGEMLYTLLDFLRLQSGYDRVSWNLQPVMLAHEVLVRCGRDKAAEVWQKAVAQRTAAVANDHLKRLERLCNKYGMRLPSVAERLGERFIRPLEVARLQGLVRPAIEELLRGGPAGAFARLEAEIEPLSREVVGAGFDVPSWLQALEEELDRALARAADEEEPIDPLLQLPPCRLSLQEARRQVEGMMR